MMDSRLTVVQPLKRYLSVWVTPKLISFRIATDSRGSDVMNSRLTVDQRLKC